MENLPLFKKISLIHAVKCNKAKSFDAAIQSFNDLSNLKNQIVNNEGTDLSFMNSTILTWQSTSPSVSDAELSELL